ncbi:MAG: hypothetical protein JNG83_12735 [Opitutaceae bacterium]|nr:hypothetical protein [Opitutaceae bacterium]
MTLAAPASAPARRFSPLLAPGLALAALLLSLCCHSPRLWAFARPLPGSAYWDRGLEFMRQVEQPLRVELRDPGLTWRLAPALLAHGLGLRGTAALAVPWAGLAALLWYGAHLALRLTGDWRLAGLFTGLLATTSATLTVTGWLGMNDAWYVLALLAAAYARPTAAWLPALFLGPWIDERFLFGLPLALWLRARTAPPGSLRPALLAAAAAVGAYLALRLTNAPGLPQAGVRTYLRHSLRHFPDWLPFAALGWLMGQRAAWYFTVRPIVAAFRADRREGLLLASLALAPLAALTLVAADTGRAPSLLLPLAFLGCAQLAATGPAGRAHRLAAGLLAANLLLPAMHVTYRNVDFINALPVELWRCLRAVPAGT